ncbi:MAG TPA: prephenate dehydratase [Solirubrobacteraceae bacterium]|jgi:prephenate dehydratase|nr:prephenate dehydratase [Solirubrobacteraceae bacterium]
MRAGYLGPEGTFTHEALLAAAGDEAIEAISLPTIYDAVMAVHDGAVDRALVPIENSLEGSVNATLDSLAIETEDVAIVGEVVHRISQCLIARAPLELSEIEAVLSHPQASGQCARFIRTELPGVRVMAAPSTADAVRILADHGGPWAALGNQVAADLYDCVVLRAGVEDGADNETRFVWLARAGSPSGAPGQRTGEQEAWKTAIVFWGAGSEAAGWLVSCLSELSSRGVNMTRIESRPRQQGLGRYMFFVDLEGRDIEPVVTEALAGLQAHVESLRVLGSFPARPEA